MLQQLVLLFIFSLLISGQGPSLPCMGRSLACALQLKLGLSHPLPSRRADCSSYQRVTVTPDTATITTTVATLTTTVTVTGPAFRRGIDIEVRAVTVIPTALPAYIFGPCTQPGIYGSACACIGIPRITTTAPTPTSFVSVTATITTTVTVPPVVGCTGRTCGSYELYLCDTPTKYCSCGIDADGGEGVCFEGGGCPTVSCTTNDDCDPGYACLIDCCCQIPNVCYRVAPGGCVRPPPQIARLALEGESPGPFNHAE